jgi:hypothetical protein
MSKTVRGVTRIRLARSARPTPLEKIGRPRRATSTTPEKPRRRRRHDRADTSLEPPPGVEASHPPRRLAREISAP